MRNFQTVLLIVFGFFIVGAVLIFSGIIKVGGGSNTQVQTAPVSLWGTIPAAEFDTIMRSAIDAGEKLNIVYSQKNTSSFEAELINALAAGNGPDLVLAPHGLLLHQADKLYPLPETVLPLRTFRDDFIEGGEVLVRAGGVLGLPLYADPLVMYWNRDMLTRAGLAVPPNSWIELQLYPQKLTEVDSTGAIGAAATALGGTANVTHFKEILAAQIMQTGDPIVTRGIITTSGAPKDIFRVVLADNGAAPSALRYYAEFANPSLPKYSWNSAKKNSLDEFIAGNLAIYFGLASDLPEILARNPHLDFDVAQLPQVSANKLTYADIYALALMKNSPHLKDAFAAAYIFALGKAAKITATNLGLPPARRDLLAAGNPDPFQAVFYNAAILGRAWFDPDPVLSRNIFSNMVESVSIGKATPEEAVSNAAEQLRGLF